MLYTQRGLKVLFVSIFVLTFTLINTPPAVAAQFSIGSGVQTTSRLNVRNVPALSGEKRGTKEVNTQGTVVDGPVTANGYQWWKIGYADGVLGWSVEKYLTFVNSAPALPAGDISTKQGYTLVIDEQFRGSSLNHSVWAAAPENAAPLLSNGEVQAYLPANVSVSNDTLVLTAKQESFKATDTHTFDFTSGEVQGRPGAVRTYGYYEWRAKLPPVGRENAGNWPALWLLANNGWTYEIDIMERFPSDNTHVYATLHWDQGAGQQQICKSVADANNWEDWHTYAVDWQPTGITIYYDGVQCGSTYTGPGVGNIPMFPIMNVALTGVNNSEPLPASMVIDYFKVYTKNEVGNTTLPLHLGAIHTDKATYNPGDTVKVHANVITGSRPIANLSGNVALYDFCGDNGIGNTSCTPRGGNNQFGDSAYIYPSIPLVAANTTHPVSWTYTLPTNMSKGIYKASVSIQDESGNYDSSSETIVAVGVPYPGQAPKQEVPQEPEEPQEPTEDPPPAEEEPVTTVTSFILSGWGQSLIKGDGKYTVTSGDKQGGATIKLGNGDHLIDITGGNNKLTTGKGNQSITFIGDNNTVVIGEGTNNVVLTGAYQNLTLGVTPRGVTKVSARGYGQTITAAKGDVHVEGSQGNSTIRLGNGDHSITMGGSGNTVIVGKGTSVIDVGIGQGTVRAEGGSVTVTATGYSNVFDVGPGNNTLHGGSGNDTFMLNSTNDGLTTITGFLPTIHDRLNVERTIANSARPVTLSTLKNFITAKISSGDTIIYYDAAGTGAAVYPIAVLKGVKTSISELLENDVFALN